MLLQELAVQEVRNQSEYAGRYERGCVAEARRICPCRRVQDEDVDHNGDRQDDDTAPVSAAVIPHAGRFGDIVQVSQIHVTLSKVEVVEHLNDGHRSEDRCAVVHQQLVMVVHEVLEEREYDDRHQEQRAWPDPLPVREEVVVLQSQTGVVEGVRAGCQVRQNNEEQCQAAESDSAERDHPFGRIRATDGIRGRRGQHRYDDRHDRKAYHVAPQCGALRLVQSSQGADSRPPGDARADSQLQ